jgi:hypothetical protein
MPAVRDKIVSVITRILKDRPLQESAEFFRGFSRALSQDERSLVPEFKDGRLQYTPKQFELTRRVTVYLLARHNWRELDKLETSQQAFHWFEKRLPEQILGNDPERIRKMFYRAGKRFKDPGRTRKRDRPPYRKHERRDQVVKRERFRVIRFVVSPEQIKMGRFLIT